MVDVLFGLLLSLCVLGPDVGGLTQPPLMRHKDDEAWAVIDQLRALCRMTPARLERQLKREAEQADIRERMRRYEEERDRRK
jgi:hypothetical protein